jgi:hypothetical protein
MRKLLTMLGAAVLLAPGATVLAQAGGFDASCQPVKAAMVAMVKTNRYHATGTMTSNGKAYPTEEIYVGDTLYRGMASHWSRTKVTPQDRIDAGQGLGLTTSGCRTVGNESVNGEAAIVYEMHSDVKQPKIHTDGRIWISTKSGLPLRMDGDSGDGADKLHGSNLYSYGAGVRAPAGT